MPLFVLDFQELDQTQTALAGGKGAHLGELTRIEGVRVPDGFCISTDVYKNIVGGNPSVGALLDRLARLQAEDRPALADLSKEIRGAIESTAIPQDVQDEIMRHLARLGEDAAYAVRSSATAEDLPTASFAGQQDTYLNIIGREAILEHVRKCWASLFTERAVLYRLQNGFDHRQVQLAVVVQRMVFPEAAGILFTADPVTGNRKVVSVDAGFGLGEALVAGLVNADNYKVRENRVIDRQIGTKKLAIYARPDGGTQERTLGPDQQTQAALTETQILELARLGRTIERHFGRPQDIEWCLADDTFYIVQSRPITTLYPVPEAPDAGRHVYVSVGHQQMMTDAMKPLGWSLWRLTPGRPMYEAGGRLFVDVAKELASPAGRHMLVNVLGKSDPLIRDALTTLVERDDFIRLEPEDQAAKSEKGPPMGNFQARIDYDPDLVPALIRRGQATVEEFEQNIRAKSGPALLDFILEDLQQLRTHFLADPQSFGAIMTAMNASSWINEHMEEWLGEKNVADTLAQSVPYNVTSEMGLALLDVADVIRDYPEVVAYLQGVKDEPFLEELEKFAGGQQSRAAIEGFLQQYGMRCAGEIDLTKPRWLEKPATLLPLLLSNIKNLGPGESKKRFGRGRQEALQKERELPDRLRQLPDGETKAAEAKRMIDLIRGYSGYREYPKYVIVQHYFIAKQALLREAGRLVQAGVLSDEEEVYYLRFEELREVVRTHALDKELIRRRKEEYRIYEKLTPPRVMTSDGEVVTGQYKREDLPAGAIAGLAVSSGVIEGRARVLLHLEEADLEEGDILVTAFTDPSWTPLFLSIKGLVTEVGGLMTHGAVIAREYGLPAVVGVENATRVIRDGQRIRVHGTEGYVELL